MNSKADCCLLEKLTAQAQNNATRANNVKKMKSAAADRAVLTKQHWRQFNRVWTKVQGVLLLGKMYPPVDHALIVLLAPAALTALILL